MTKRENWTVENIATEAKKYSTRGEFKRQSKRAYGAAVSKKILNDVCQHMPLTRYTVKDIKAEAAKYDSRSDFKEGSLGAYDAAVRHKILDEVCQHMTTKHRKWTMQDLQKEANKYKTNAEFKEGSPAAFSTAYRWNVMDQLCSHMDKIQESWPIERITKEALKYRTRKEFKEQNPKAYNAAKSRKLVNQVCAHMKVLKRDTYTNEEIVKAAAKYQTRTRFSEGSKGEYMAAQRRGILDEVCAHMEKGKGTDGDAVYFWEVLLPNGDPLIYNGEPVYKLGVTSYRLMDRRIQQVAKTHGFKVGRKSIAQYDNAYHIERIVLGLTEPVPMAKKDGSTEFRTLKREDRMRVVCIFAGAHMRPVDDPDNLPSEAILFADGARALSPKLLEILQGNNIQYEGVLLRQNFFKKKFDPNSQ